MVETRLVEEGGSGPPRCRDVFGDEALHRVVVVGGGAAGLELVTRLGDETDIGCRVEVSSTADRSARSKAKLKSM